MCLKFFLHRKLLHKPGLSSPPALLPQAADEYLGLWTSLLTWVSHVLSLWISILWNDSTLEEPEHITVSLFLCAFRKCATSWKHCWNSCNNITSSSLHRLEFLSLVFSTDCQMKQVLWMAKLARCFALFHFSCNLKDIKAYFKNWSKTPSSVEMFWIKG